MRCVDCLKAEERWRYDPPQDSHVLAVSYQQSDHCFYAVQRQYQSGSSRILLRFDANSGRHEELCQLNSWEEICCLNGDLMVTSDGDVIALEEGRIINRLAVPQESSTRVL